MNNADVRDDFRHFPRAEALIPPHTARARVINVFRKSIDPSGQSPARQQLRQTHVLADSRMPQPPQVRAEPLLLLQFGEDAKHEREATRAILEAEEPNNLRAIQHFTLHDFLLSIARPRDEHRQSLSNLLQPLLAKAARDISLPCCTSYIPAQPQLHVRDARRLLVFILATSELEKFVSGIIQPVLSSVYPRSYSIVQTKH